MREWNAGLVKRPNDKGPAKWREGNTGQFFASKGGERGEHYCTDAEGNAVIWRATACIGPTLDSKDALPLDQIDQALFSPRESLAVTPEIFDAAGQVPFASGWTQVRSSTGRVLSGAGRGLRVPGTAGPGADNYKIGMDDIKRQIQERETQRLAALQKRLESELAVLDQQGASGLSAKRKLVESQLCRERKRSEKLLSAFVPRLPMAFDKRFPSVVPNTCPPYFETKSPEGVRVSRTRWGPSDTPAGNLAGLQRRSRRPLA